MLHRGFDGSGQKPRLSNETKKIQVPNIMHLVVVVVLLQLLCIAIDFLS